MNPSTSLKRTLVAAALLVGVGASVTASAYEWSDTALTYKYGTRFTEPYLTFNGPTQNIKKDYFVLSHANGYKYGNNLFVIDYIKSDNTDPVNAGTQGATEFYAIYRHNLSLSKVTGSKVGFGPVNDVGIVAGFNVSSKNTTFAPAVRKFVLGPRLSFDVKGGFWDLDFLYFKENNHCGTCTFPGQTLDVSFKGAYELATAWSVPFGESGFKFDGRAAYLGKKGNNGNNTPTSPETYFEGRLMYDIMGAIANKKNTLYLGVGYQYWNNKFGNNATPPGIVASGIKTNAPMLVAEFHF